MSHPCGTCEKNCTRMCVFCEVCESWFHYKCHQLNKDQFLALSKSKNCDFVCKICCVTKEGAYDYQKALIRLEGYANRKVLDEGVYIESVLVRNEDLRVTIETGKLKGLVEDRVSKQIVKTHHMHFHCHLNRSNHEIILHVID